MGRTGALADTVTSGGLAGSRAYAVPKSRIAAKQPADIFLNRLNLVDMGFLSLLLDFVIIITIICRDLFLVMRM